MPLSLRGRMARVLASAALAASVIFLFAAIGADPRNSLWAFALLVLSYPAYLVARR